MADYYGLMESVRVVDEEGDWLGDTGNYCLLVSKKSFKGEGIDFSYAEPVCEIIKLFFRNECDLAFSAYVERDKLLTVLRRIKKIYKKTDQNIISFIKEIPAFPTEKCGINSMFIANYFKKSIKVSIVTDDNTSFDVYVNMNDFHRIIEDQKSE